MLGFSSCCGGQNQWFWVPFWWVCGEFTTHFGTDFSGLQKNRETTFQFFGGNMGYMSAKGELPQGAGSFQG